MGDLFVALPFADGDAHSHVKEALSRGAGVALVAESWRGFLALSAEEQARCVRVPDVVGCFRGFAAWFRRRVTCPVVAVIGSNGKTTTKEMIAALLSPPGRWVVRTPGTDNGYLGLPRTLCARQMREGEMPDAIVVEIGIDARGAMPSHARLVAPDVVVVTALGAEHLDGLGDVETAIAEELSIFEEVPSARRVVLWGEEERASVLRGALRPRRSDFGRASPGSPEMSGLVRRGDVAVVVSRHGEAGGVPEGASSLVARVETRGEKSLVDVAWYPESRSGEAVWSGRFEVPMPGAHNARNFALAMGAALSLGWSGEECALGWPGFEAPAWRSSVRRLARGALMVVDCFNASPLSVRAALEALSDEAWRGRPKVIVLGDMLELGAESERWHVELAGALGAIQDADCYFFGPGMAALGRALPQGVKRVIEDVSRDPVELVRDMELPSGAIVLVKGSRGRKMERVAEYLARRWPAESSAVVGDSAGAKGEGQISHLVSDSARAKGAERISILVSGSLGVRGVVGAISASLRLGIMVNQGEEGGARREGALGAQAFERRLEAQVIEVPHEDIPVRAIEAGSKVIVWTGLAEEMSAGKDVELYLAEEAQLFVKATDLLAVILNGEDPASELLAEVVPKGVRILRFGGGGPRGATAASLVGDVLAPLS